MDSKGINKEDSATQRPVENCKLQIANCNLFSRRLLLICKFQFAFFNCNCRLLSQVASPRRRDLFAFLVGHLRVVRALYSHRSHPTLRGFSASIPR